MAKDVILTGLRSNDEFQLGNYLGGILPMVNLQKKYAGKAQINMFVPDLHSFTTPINHDALYKQTITNLKYFVAGGLDINGENTYFYRQSYIPAHSELAWILSCFTSMGELSRMTQYKDKAETSPNVGLFNYPVLMAADILLYDAKYIPLGDDQKQHIEYTREIAQRLNKKFGEIFVVPAKWDEQVKFSGRSDSVRIRSLKNPDKKMSKSVSDPSGTIKLGDDPFEAAKKVLSATTDSFNKINYDWKKQPGVSNLLQILALLTNQSIDKLTADWANKSSYVELKGAVAEAVKQTLSDIQSKFDRVNETDLIKKLETDEIEISKIANKKLLKIQQAVGLRP
ncbi:MAG TPA: tryptophan--tRNA ligase [Candidatus Saccharimonadales bacterium]|nr:tryptophan--tRNA ligase [Candidatus Saccharimonadales bacterium]